MQGWRGRGVGTLRPGPGKGWPPSGWPGVRAGHQAGGRAWHVCALSALGHPAHSVLIKLTSRVRQRLSITPMRNRGRMTGVVPNGGAAPPVWDERSATRPGVRSDHLDGQPWWAALQRHSWSAVAAEPGLAPWVGSVEASWAPFPVSTSYADSHPGTHLLCGARGHATGPPASGGAQGAVGSPSQGGRKGGAGHSPDAASGEHRLDWVQRAAPSVLPAPAPRLPPAWARIAVIPGGLATPPSPSWTRAFPRISPSSECRASLWLLSGFRSPNHLGKTSRHLPPPARHHDGVWVSAHTYPTGVHMLT